MHTIQNSTASTEYKMKRHANVQPSFPSIPSGLVSVVAATAQNLCSGNVEISVSKQKLYDLKSFLSLVHAPRVIGWNQMFGHRRTCGLIIWSKYRPFQSFMNLIIIHLNPVTGSDTESINLWIFTQKNREGLGVPRAQTSFMITSKWHLH